MKRKLIISKLPFSIILALLLVGCAKNNTVNLQTPAQRVAVYNGILAESNRALVTGVIVLQQNKVLTVSQTRTVLVYSDRVLNASTAVAVLQQSPGDWVVNALQIKVILDQITPSGDILKLFGANTEQSKVVLASITSIQSAIQSILKEVTK
jgi:type IV pilus biogenesis protein CpaD/CtpE